MIPLNDLSRACDLEDLAEIARRVFAAGRMIQGPTHDAFEEALARYLGDGRIALGCASGTDALTLALAAVGGSRVLTAANAGGYATSAIRRLGMTPVYADVSPESLCLGPAEVSPFLGSVDAVVVTHLYGRIGEIEEIAKICASAGVYLIEDCAQALGGRSPSGRAAGTFGDAAAFSFYPTKNLGALGDAGTVAVRSPELATRIRRLRQYGWETRYLSIDAGGINSRLDELQAAFLLRRLPGLDAANGRRRLILRRYAAALPALVGRIPSVGDGHAAHLAVTVCHTPSIRDRLRKAMASAGVETATHYPIPDYQQPAYRDGADVFLPVTEALCRNIVTLPCFPEMTEEEIGRVCAALTTC